MICNCIITGSDGYIGECLRHELGDINRRVFHDERMSYIYSPDNNIYYIDSAYGNGISPFLKVSVDI